MWSHHTRYGHVPKLKQHLISPVLSVLTDLADDKRLIRKYLRHRILPFLRDIYRRPEVGTSFRNKVVRLMTSVTDVSQLFVVYKSCCLVERFIKYTGFGNAFGMLSARSFLVPKKQDLDEECSPDEDSETEEYAQAKEFINPVTGCYEEPHPNPTDDMSEEQKEYEAMELVKNIDKLMK
ncbi:unnamed protein product [Soboliphyme baturini]|uniref:DRIM domain-containing protein n=1 Tax=Soboliphyme baturini TaxID=241478 RepID=A0A183II50_9BILA|nr:unnamed protein product [Soboliphyme baturini]